MDKHIEKAMQLRNNARCPNCAETIMMTYAEELGLSESQMKALGTNFGGGIMDCRFFGIFSIFAAHRERV